MSKKFLSYAEQMDKLNNKKKIKCEGEDNLSLLVQNGYFNMVNGYKLPFTSSKDISGNHIYEKGTSIEDIFAVKNFDDKLRLLLFSYIVRIEEEIRTLTGYKFDEINEYGAIRWYQTKAYNNQRNTQKEISRNISIIIGDVDNSKSEYVRHYKENHQEVPTWILTKVTRFSTFIKMLDQSKTYVKKSLCELYGMKTTKGYTDYKLLVGSLHHIRVIRNACAHNERVFDIGIKESKRINCSYFNELPDSYLKSQDMKKIMDFIVYMRYYLDDDSFCSLIDSIDSLLVDLKESISKNAYDYVRGKMGIKNESHLQTLKKNKKSIDYLDFNSK